MDLFNWISSVDWLSVLEWASVVSLILIVFIGLMGVFVARFFWDNLFEDKDEIDDSLFHAFLCFILLLCMKLLLIFSDIWYLLFPPAPMKETGIKGRDAR